MTGPARVGVLVGNPRQASRTSRAACEVADQVARAVSGEVTVIVELGEHGADVLRAEAERVRRDLDTLAQLDLLVVASPTYKATYTGLLKAFLDRCPNRGLAEVVAVPVMVGGNPDHALALDVHLRPLLVELGAVVPAAGLFILDNELDRLPDTVRAWLDVARPALRASIASSHHL